MYFARKVGNMNFNKKQKIIIAIIIIAVAAGFCYYLYNRESSFIITQDDLEIEENKQEEKMEEKEAEEGEEEAAEERKKDNKIKVHISGAVNKEGIIELEEESRIADAIEKAGGLKENANIDEINLAYKLEDGIKVYIPTKEEKEKTLIENNNYITKSSDIQVEENKNGTTKPSKVNINTATQTELETLPGIGPSTALKIIQYREENGKFKKIEEIQKVNGIGENKFKNIKDLICI